MMPPMLQKFVDQYTGKLANFDGSPQNAGQSVQLVAMWCQFLGLPYQWANAADWWDDSDDTFYEHWDKISRPQSSTLLPRPGDIIVFSNRLPGSNSYGHLSIFLDSQEGSSEWKGLDANWGGMSTHVQSHNWAYVVGWFTPVNRAVLEAPIPTAIADAVTVAPFDVDPIKPKTVFIKQDNTPVYNLADLSWDSFSTNPIRYVSADDDISVSALAYHRFGGTFYLTSATSNEGYSVDDCDEDEPPQEVKKDKGYSAPKAAPNKDDTIRVKEKVSHYHTMSDALQHRNPVGELVAGEYLVYNRLPNGMLHVTPTLGQPSGFWINPKDLEERDWRVLVVEYPFPRLFRAKRRAAIADLEGKGKPLSIAEHQPIYIVGTFIGPDKQEYAAPEPTFKHNQWYGIHVDLLEPVPPKPKAIVPPQPIVSTPETVTVGTFAPYAKMGSVIKSYRQALKTAKERYKA